MCVRFTLVADQIILADHFSMPELLDYPVNESRYNIAPSQQVPIIHLENNFLRLTPMSWGLIPSWADSYSTVRPINARLETLTAKPIFKRLLNHKRCLIPFSGFYEWKDNTSPKQPYFFSIAHLKVFGVAGLWDQRVTPAGKIEYSFTLITAPASSDVSHVHHRMPFILDAQYYQEWLQNPYFSLINKQLQVPLHNHPVSSALNSAKYDDPSLKEYVY